MSGGVGLLANGRWCGGMGTLGVWAEGPDGQPVNLVASPAGQAAAAFNNEILYAANAPTSTAPFGSIRSIHLDGSGDRQVAASPATFIAGDLWSPLFAFFLADGMTGVVSSSGPQWPTAGLLGVRDGVIYLKTSYQNGGISAHRSTDGAELWRLDELAQPDISNNLPQFSALDVGRCMWTQGATVRQRGILKGGQPWEDGGVGVFDPWIGEPAQGSIWIVHHGGPVVARPWGSPTRGIIIDPAGGYYTTARVVDATHLDVAYARGPGANGDVVVVRVDLTQPLADLAPPPVYDPIVAIGRRCWFGWYAINGPRQAPHNSRLDLPPNTTPPPPPKPAYITDVNGRRIYRYVQATPDSDVDNLELQIATAKAEGETLPIVPYWTARAQAVRVPRGADVYGIELYQHAGETNADFYARGAGAITRVPRALLIGGCYTSNAGNTRDLRTVPPVISRLAATYENVEGIVNFSAGDRPTGWEDHAEVHADWQAVFDGIPGPPVGPDPHPPDPEVPMLKIGDRVAIRRHDPGPSEHLDSRGQRMADWIKGVIIDHQDRQYLDSGNPIVGFTMDFPGGNPNAHVATFNDKGEIDGERNSAGARERMTIDGDRIILARPDCGKDGRGVCVPYDVVRL